MTVVAVVAHPDDESLIAGGTLALAARAGVPTGILSLTRGEIGPISDPALATPATLADVREAEFSAAGAQLGVAWSVCLRHPDGELPWVDRSAAAAELAAVLARHGACAVLTFGRDGVYGHPDHAAAGEIAAAACATIGRDKPIDRYHSVWSPDTMAALCREAAARDLPTGLWGLEPDAFGSWDAPATITIDVGAVIERKLGALREHRTQLDPGHLLAALPVDLARRHLGHESWCQVGSDPGGGVLADLLASNDESRPGALTWRA